ncbi:uncharacterized protein ACBT57_012974 isoform 1-T1 [Dama dama]
MEVSRLHWPQAGGRYFVPVSPGHTSVRGKTEPEQGRGLPGSATRKQQGGALQGVNVAMQPSIRSPAAGYPLSPPPQTQVLGDVFVHTGDDPSVCAKKPLPAFPCLCTRVTSQVLAPHPSAGHQTGGPWKVGAHVLGEAGIDWSIQQRTLQLW